jgi:hypothetical protein
MPSITDCSSIPTVQVDRCHLEEQMRPLLAWVLVFAFITVAGAARPAWAQAQPPAAPGLAPPQNAPANAQDLLQQIAQLKKELEEVERLEENL